VPARSGFGVFSMGLTHTC